MRQSTTDLKVATADQVNKLLFQANDAALMKVEKEDRILSERRGNVDTLKGYMSASQREGHEVNFCVRPRSTRLFSILEISELNKDSALLTDKNNGYCDPSNDDDYVSEGRVITQMTFVRPTVTEDAGIFYKEVEGTLSNDFEKPETGGNVTIECTSFVGYVTSIIPALSQAPLGNTGTSMNDTTTIAGCLKKPRTGVDTVDTCLTALGVPFQTQQQTYLNQPVGVECVSGS
nr:hypothetical protein [uncultured Psychrobacter sp.]